MLIRKFPVGITIFVIIGSSKYWKCHPCSSLETVSVCSLYIVMAWLLDASVEGRLFEVLCPVVARLLVAVDEPAPLVVVVRAVGVHDGPGNHHFGPVLGLPIVDVVHAKVGDGPSGQHVLAPPWDEHASCHGLSRRHSKFYHGILKYVQRDTTNATKHVEPGLAVRVHHVDLSNPTVVWGQLTHFQVLFPPVPTIKQQ